jgi:hypothetical protein
MDARKSLRKRLQGGVIIATAVLLSLPAVMQPAFSAARQCSTPVVSSVTPSNGRGDIPQDLLITGSNFLLPGGVANVTSVFAVEIGNPGNVIQATSFTVLNASLIDAFFNFGVASLCKSFHIFVSGPCGTSPQPVVGGMFVESCNTPLQRIAFLKNKVTQLVDSDVLSRRQGRALTRNLNKAINRLEGGNEEGAINQLQGFIEEVNQLIAAGELTVAQAQPLLDLANSIIDQIGG